MMSDLTTVLTFVTALGSAVIGGVFFAFSTFVMTALASRPPAEGIAAMQAINVKVLNPWFLGVFLGTALGSAALVVLALFAWSQPGAVLQLTGALLYLGGNFGVTMAYNVPRNEALTRLAPDSPGAAEHWAAYVRSWTAWNHVRTTAGIGAAIALIWVLHC